MGAPTHTQKGSMSTNFSNLNPVLGQLLTKVICYRWRYTNPDQVFVSSNQMRTLCLWFYAVMDLLLWRTSSLSQPPITKFTSHSPRPPLVLWKVTTEESECNAGRETARHHWLFHLDLNSHYRFAIWFMLKHFWILFLKFTLVPNFLSPSRRTFCFASVLNLLSTTKTNSTCLTCQNVIWLCLQS